MVLCVTITSTLTSVLVNQASVACTVRSTMMTVLKVHVFMEVRAMTKSTVTSASVPLATPVLIASITKTLATPTHVSTEHHATTCTQHIAASALMVSLVSVVRASWTCAQKIPARMEQPASNTPTLSNACVMGTGRASCVIFHMCPVPWLLKTKESLNPSSVRMEEHVTTGEKHTLAPVVVVTRGLTAS